MQHNYKTCMLNFISRIFIVNYILYSSLITKSTPAGLVPCVRRENHFNVQRCCLKASTAKIFRESFGNYFRNIYAVMNGHN